MNPEGTAELLEDAEETTIFERISYQFDQSGITEETPGYWCYAAVEQAIRIFMLSQPITQEEIAHKFFLSYAQAGQTGAGDVGTIASYAKEICRAVDTEYAENTFDEHHEAVKFSFNADYAAITQHLDNHDGVRQLLKRAYGDLALANDLTCQHAGDLDWTAVTRTIEADGVVVYGSALHFYVIIGYRSDLAKPDDLDSFFYRVWDPANGQARWLIFHTIDDPKTVIHVTP